MRIALALVLGLFCFSAHAAKKPDCKVSGCGHECLPYDAPVPPDSCAWTMLNRCYDELAVCSKQADGSCAFDNSVQFERCKADPEGYFLKSKGASL